MNDSNHIWKWLYESRDGPIQVNYGKTYHNKSAENWRKDKNVKSMHFLSKMFMIYF